MIEKFGKQIMSFTQSFTEFGRIHGPIAEVAEDYVPNKVISDQEFNGFYARSTDPSYEETNENLFYARDYVVDQLHQATRTAYAEGYSCTAAVLEELPKERLRALFWGLKNCTCCWRHCHNKPVAIDSWDDESMLDRATVEMVSKRNCFCHCRMGKRMLRKAFFECADMPELETQPATSESEDEA
jgi:hypothetical protein